MELVNKGKYFFTIGNYEVGCYQNSNLKDSKYIGRFKTKDKYLALLSFINVDLIKKETMKLEAEEMFFDECSDFIIGDVFFIEDINVEKELDDLECINNNSSIKENIIVTNIETSTSFFNNNKSSFIDGEKKINEELKCFTYFSNIGYLSEELKSTIDTINEYKEEHKFETRKKLIELDMILNGKNVHEFVNELKELKDKKDGKA